MGLIELLLCFDFFCFFEQDTAATLEFGKPHTPLASQFTNSRRGLVIIKHIRSIKQHIRLWWPSF